MFEIIIVALAFGAGLLVGWNFLVQPAKVKAFIDRRRAD